MARRSKTVNPTGEIKNPIQRASELVDWYQQSHRDLPWRKSRDPYHIWISEIMLQQTTSRAVIPYYQNFMKRFPNVKKLAQAPLSLVLEAWAGLGYYSRARNLHKAAQILAEKGFAKSYIDLMDLPGFGPYTSRAVSSFAFDEPVGVLDGNVIRVLSRFLGKKIEWWTTSGRNSLQTVADIFAQSNQSHNVNQALMEMGATMCTPQSPSCFLCPWNKNCEARRQGLQDQLPLKKEKQKSYMILWTPEIVIQDQKIALVENNYAPFLKKEKIFPGTIEYIQSKPKDFTYKHGITRYEIFVCLKKARRNKATVKASEIDWVPVKKLSQKSPFALLTKAMEHF